MVSGSSCLSFGWCRFSPNVRRVDRPHEMESRGSLLRYPLLRFFARWCRLTVIRLLDPCTRRGVNPCVLLYSLTRKQIEVSSLVVDVAADRLVVQSACEPLTSLLDRAVCLRPLPKGCRTRSVQSLTKGISLFSRLLWPNVLLFPLLCLLCLFGRPISPLTEHTTCNIILSTLSQSISAQIIFSKCWIRTQRHSCSGEFTKDYDCLLLSTCGLLKR
jgi:hypothetical protein